jgi:predicted RNase H-like HicB family nuclease
MLKYRVIIEKDEEGILVAKVPDLPGCATEGKTKAELMKNVKEQYKRTLRLFQARNVELIPRNYISQLASICRDRITMCLSKSFICS